MEEIVVYVETRLRAVMVIRIQLCIVVVVVVVVAVNEGDTILLLKILIDLHNFEDFIRTFAGPQSASK